jgi:7-cyano-7-deazaguanine synthase in queuosine biosynthesis
MKIAVLNSGGLDSLILSYYANTKYPDAQIVECFYNIGQESLQAEEFSVIQHMKATNAKVQRRKVDWLNKEIQPMQFDEQTGPVHIPARNAVFLLLAAAQELPDEVWLGANYSEFQGVEKADKSWPFVKIMNELLSYTLTHYKNPPPQVRVPFVEDKLTKRDAVKWALENGMSTERIVNATSCWHGGWCGNCWQCVRSWCIFYWLNIEQGLEKFKQHPMASPRMRPVIANWLKEGTNHYYEVEHEMLEPINLWMRKNNISSHYFD